MNADAIVHLTDAWIDIYSEKIVEQNIETTSSSVNESSFVEQQQQVRHIKAINNVVQG